MLPSLPSDVCLYITGFLLPNSPTTVGKLASTSKKMHTLVSKSPLLLPLLEYAEAQHMLDISKSSPPLTPLGEM